MSKKKSKNVSANAGVVGTSAPVVDAPETSTPVVDAPEENAADTYMPDANSQEELEPTVVRVLRTVVVQGTVYRANQLVSFTADELKTFDSSAADASKAAVNYCEKLGVEIIVHGAVEETATDEETKITGESE